jgi:hypothetical protein
VPATLRARRVFHVGQWVSERIPPVQGSSRAEADFGPRRSALPVALLHSAIPDDPLGHSTAISRAPWTSPDRFPIIPLIPPLMGPPGGGGPVGAGLGPFARSYVGVRPIDRSPIDGPPSSAHSGRSSGGRTISRPCGPGAHSHASKSGCGCAAIPAFKLGEFLHMLSDVGQTTLEGRSE